MSPPRVQKSSKFVPIFGLLRTWSGCTRGISPDRPTLSLIRGDRLVEFEVRESCTVSSFVTASLNRADRRDRVEFFGGGGGDGLRRRVEREEVRVSAGFFEDFGVDTGACFEGA